MCFKYKCQQVDKAFARISSYCHTSIRPPKCIFLKRTQFACLLSFANLFCMNLPESWVRLKYYHSPAHKADSVRLGAKLASQRPLLRNPELLKWPKKLCCRAVKGVTSNASVPPKKILAPHRSLFHLKFITELHLE